MLTFLSLEWCKAVTKDGIAHVAALPRLETLSLEGCEQVDDEGMAALKTAPALESLNIARCENITDSGLAALLTHTRLRQLNTARCEEVHTHGSSPCRQSPCFALAAEAAGRGMCPQSDHGHGACRFPTWAWRSWRP